MSGLCDFFRFAILDISSLTRVEDELSQEEEVRGHRRGPHLRDHRRLSICRKFFLFSPPSFAEVFTLSFSLLFQSSLSPESIFHSSSVFLSSLSGGAKWENKKGKRKGEKGESWGKDLSSSLSSSASMRCCSGERKKKKGRRALSKIHGKIPLSLSPLRRCCVQQQVQRRGPVGTEHSVAGGDDGTRPRHNPLQAPPPRERERRGRGWMRPVAAAVRQNFVGGPVSCPGLATKRRGISHRCRSLDKVEGSFVRISPIYARCLSHR